MRPGRRRDRPTGSQPWNGVIPTFVPKPTRKSANATPLTVASIPGAACAQSANEKLPVWAYSSAKPASSAPPPSLFITPVK
jgi:hypothetical protein